MRHILISLILLCISLSSAAQDLTRADCDRYIRLIIDSEMKQHPEAWTIDGQKVPKWNYTQGFELKAMMDYADRQGSDYQRMIYEYAQTYTDRLISAEGKIQGYKMADYKLDAVNSGKILFRLYSYTGKKQYQTAIDTLMSHIKRQPRTADGGFWHKTIYTQQMWLDGLYMAAPFYAEYAVKAGDDEMLLDALNQYCIIYSHTYCKKCRLLHHAWDEAHRQPWANPKTGLSAHAWGRAEGWYLMGLVDAMEIAFHRLGANHPKMAELRKILNQLCNNLLRYQDKGNGCWQQVLDMTGKPGNYYEMSATPMIAYAYLKGARMGWLADKYKIAANKAIRGIIVDYLLTEEDGTVILTNICGVAGLSADRDGSYEYYLSEKIVDNDPKGIGALILALDESCR